MMNDSAGSRQQPHAIPYMIDAMDAVEYLRALPDQSVDLIASDPAYQSLEKHRKVGTTTRLKRFFPIFPDERLPDFVAECYRVLKKNTHIYLMCDFDTMLILAPMLATAGFKVWKALVWCKSRGIGYHYPTSHEYILFAEKGKRKLNTNDYLSWQNIKPLRGKKYYPTEKPRELIEILISESSSPGEVVADPFGGSWSTGDAAIRLGRQFIGSDISQESLGLAAQRLGAAVQMRKQHLSLIDALRQVQEQKAMAAAEEKLRQQKLQELVLVLKKGFIQKVIDQEIRGALARFAGQEHDRKILVGQVVSRLMPEYSVNIRDGIMPGTAIATISLRLPEVAFRHPRTMNEVEQYLADGND